jgi:hypothetical protein
VREGAWAFGVPLGGGSLGGDPTSGNTGTNVFGYNLAGDYTNNLPETNLTAGPFDLTGVTGTHLTFFRWLGIESSSFDHASVRVSNDGLNWTTVFNHVGGTFNDLAWVFQDLNISAVADNEPTVFVRWVMGTTDSSVTLPGWNIDDVQILGNAPVPGSLSVTPTTANFSIQLQFDATSDITKLTVVNVGGDVANINSVQVLGTNAGEFVLSNSLPSSLAPGQIGQVHVYFAPETPGSKSATLRIVTDAGNTDVPLTAFSVRGVFLNAAHLGQQLGTQQNPFKDIDDAVSAVPTSGEILTKPGNYNFPDPVTINKAMTIKKDGTGAGSIVINVTP